MTDLSAKLSGLPNARPLPGVANAWEWSPAPRFLMLAALSSDRQYVFRLGTRDSHAPDLCREFLDFALTHEVEFIARPEPLIAVPGFSWPGWRFDAVGRARPEVYQFFSEDPDLRDVTFEVFPAYLSEISGFESVDQAAERFRRMIKVSDLNREPSPYVLVRFDNPRTGAGTIGDMPTFVSPSYLQHELRLLEGAREAYLELRNYRNERWLVRWDGQWRVEGGAEALQMSLDEVLGWAMSVIG